MTRPFALMAEFQEPDALIVHAKALRDQGFHHLDAYTPFPVEGLAEAIGFADARVPRAFLIGGIIGALTGYFLQVWTNGIDYPLWIGGRHPTAPPAFTLIAFELMVLFAVVAGVGTMLVLNRMPRLHHPLFDAKEFHRASRDRFFLAILAEDDGFNAEAARQALAALKPLEVIEVQRD